MYHQYSLFTVVKLSKVTVNVSTEIANIELLLLRKTQG